MKDTEDSLRELNAEIETRSRHLTVLQKAVFREKMRVVMRFQADSREFSIFHFFTYCCIKTIFLTNQLFSGSSKNALISVVFMLDAYC